MSVQEEEIILALADPPVCDRCSGLTLLLAQFPHSRRNSRGEDVNGVREAALCPACDQGETAADALMALFAVNEQIDFANAETFAELVAAWVESVRHRHVDNAVLDEEHERWRRGEL
ncbi:DUF6300 family protein [Streptomyces sp. NPDC002133]|uniref:DUF6300 family protein n=1 Tax=Streptomyces sp. NPDC002133 TaxID=3154409 RepID=UPI0033213471